MLNTTGSVAHFRTSWRELAAASSCIAHRRGTSWMPRRSSMAGSNPLYRGDNIGRTAAGAGQAAYAAVWRLGRRRQRQMGSPSNTGLGCQRLLLYHGHFHHQVQPHCSTCCLN